jgi:hypothetical protein
MINNLLAMTVRPAAVPNGEPSLRGAGRNNKDSKKKSPRGNPPVFSIDEIACLPQAGFVGHHSQAKRIYNLLAMAQ